MKRGAQPDYNNQWAKFSAELIRLRREEDCVPKMHKFFTEHSAKIGNLKVNNIIKSVYVASIMNRAHFVDASLNNGHSFVDDILKQWQKNGQIDDMFKFLLKSKKIGVVVSFLNSIDVRNPNLAKFAELCSKKPVDKMGNIGKSAFEIIAETGDTNDIKQSLHAVRGLDNYLEIITNEFFKKTRPKGNGEFESAFQFLAREGNCMHIVCSLSAIKHNYKARNEFLKELLLPIRQKRNGEFESTLSFIVREGNAQDVSFLLNAAKYNPDVIDMLAKEILLPVRQKRNGEFENTLSFIAREGNAQFVSLLLNALKNQRHSLFEFVKECNKPTRINKFGQKCSAIDNIVDFGLNTGLDTGLDTGVTQAINALCTEASINNTGSTINPRLIELCIPILESSKASNINQITILESLCGVYQSTLIGPNNENINAILLSKNVSDLLKREWGNISHNSIPYPGKLTDILEILKKAESIEDIHKAKHLTKIMIITSCIGKIVAQKTEVKKQNDVAINRSAQFEATILKAFINVYIRNWELDGRFPSRDNLNAFVINQIKCAEKEELANATEIAGTQETNPTLKTNKEDVESTEAKQQPSQNSSKKSRKNKRSEPVTELEPSRAQSIGESDIENIEEFEAKRQEKYAKQESKRIQELSRKLEKAKANKAIAKKRESEISQQSKQSPQNKAEPIDNMSEATNIAKLEASRAARYCSCTIL